MNKKALLFTLIFAALLIATPVYAETKVLLNGKVLIFDVPPVVENGRTLVPVRVIFEALGAQITYDTATDTVIATRGTTVIKLKIGGNALKNGQPVNLDVPAKIVSGRTLVPIRFISESLGATVNYDDAAQTIKISSSGAPSEPEVIFLQVDPSVFSLEVYDEYGNALGLGSGFVIDSTGKAVTNYHVIYKAYSARAKFTDGRIVNINKILYSNKERDVAIIQLESNNYASLTLGNSNGLVTGQKILAIGNPLGLDNTISDGLVSSAKRDIDGSSYIQITAPISPGSSGGVLLNYQGEVVGVTTAYFENGQNLNFAIPINDVKAKLSSTENARDLQVYQKIVKDLILEDQYLTVKYPSNWYKEVKKKANAVSSVILINADSLKSNLILTWERSVDISLADYVKYLIRSYEESPDVPYETYEVIPAAQPIQINNQTFYQIKITGYLDDTIIEQAVYLTKKNSDIYFFILSSKETDFAPSFTVLENMLKTLIFK